MFRVYLTYQEYKTRGGDLPQSSFNLLEFKCRKRIDYLTDSRVQNMAEIPEAVKMCMLALVSVESKVGVTAQAEKPVVTSFNSDGYSETYGKAMGAEESSRAMDGMVRTYLSGENDDNGIPLLYRGVT